MKLLVPLKLSTIVWPDVKDSSKLEYSLSLAKFVKALNTTKLATSSAIL